MDNLPAKPAKDSRVNLPKFRDKLETILNDCYADNIIEMDELEHRLDLVQSARNHGDLEKIIEDLPDTYQKRYFNMPAEADKNSFTPVKPFNVLTSVMSEKIFRGLSLGGNFTKIRSVMADTKVDLRNIIFPGNKTEINIINVMSDLTIIVPENAKVHTEFHSVMASHEESPDINHSSADGPVIRITGNSVMANIRIMTG
ncbi:MAG: DUF1707 and DUF2154 domain-containing protein [Spirochaetales bacterium]|nr:DUF1707 and DUF2154 domain-containing protein [Spirochaetales bacterium]